MDPAINISRDNSLDVLKNYEFQAKGSTTDWLCVKTENGVESLVTVKKDDFTWKNRFLRIFNEGPLAHCDTSLEGVDRFVTQLLASEGSTQAKTDDVAAKSMVPMEHLVKVKFILEQFPDGVERSIPVDDLILMNIYLEDRGKSVARMITKDTPIEALETVVALVKENDETSKDIARHQGTGHWFDSSTYREPREQMIRDNDKAIDELLKPAKKKRW